MRKLVLVLACGVVLALQGCTIGGPGKIIESAVTGDWRTDYEKLCVPSEKITEDARLFCEWNAPKSTAPAPSAPEGMAPATP